MCEWVGFMYTHTFDVYFYVYIYVYYKCGHVYMAVCTHVCTHTGIGLCSALKQTYLQQPIFILIPGFILMFDLEKALVPCKYSAQIF